MHPCVLMCMCTKIATISMLKLIVNSQKSSYSFCVSKPLLCFHATHSVTPLLRGLKRILVLNKVFALSLSLFIFQSLCRIPLIMALAKQLMTKRFETKVGCRCGAALHLHTCTNFTSIQNAATTSKEKKQMNSFSSRTMQLAVCCVSEPRKK